MAKLSLEKRKERAAKINALLKKLFPEKVDTELTYSNPWELLVATMLSAQSTDRTINTVTPALFKKYPTVSSMAGADLEEVEKYIHASGFYHAKAKNLIATAQLVRDNFGGKVPQTMAEMLTLRGVARKTSNIVLYLAYEKIEGVPVDTHVRRLSNVWGLTDSQDPAKIEKDLMEVLPKKDWVAFTLRAVLYGRRYCTGRPHDHAKCPLTKVLAA